MIGKLEYELKLMNTSTNNFMRVQEQMKMATDKYEFVIGTVVLVLYTRVN